MSLRTDQATSSRITVENVDDDEIVFYPNPGSDGTKTPPISKSHEDNSHALVTTTKYMPPPSNFASKISQQRKDEDDSKSAYISGQAPIFGSFENAPSAPPLTNDEYQDYENWLRETQISLREEYPKHQEWQENLARSGLKARAFNPVVAISDLPEDKISNQFKDKIKHAITTKDKLATSRAINLFLGRETIRTKNSTFSLYKPEAYRNPAAGEVTWEKKLEAGMYDEVTEMIKIVDNMDGLKSSYISKKVGTGQEIRNNHFIIASDENGTANATKYMIWGPGNKVSFGLASTNLKMIINKVQDSREYDMGETYIHIPERLTIVTITENERGFCLNRETNEIQEIKMGRYFLNEKKNTYIGKVTLKKSDNYLPIEGHTDCNSAFIKKLAKRFQVVLVMPGQIAFVKDREGTYALQSRDEAYILDKQRNEEFINFVNANEKTLTAADNSYTIINNLLPGEYTVFKFENNLIAWFHDEHDATLNTIHLPAQFFKFDGKIHRFEQEPFSDPEMTVIFVRPNNTLVVKDNEQRLRFIEQATENKPLVFRRPWQFIDMIARSKQEYVYGDAEKGTSVARISSGSNDWIAVLTQKGRLEFFPSLLDGTPYYFYQPEHQFIAIINKNVLGATKINVPTIGEVNILNLASGQIASCRIRNMHFFLEAQPNPYVLVPPNKFLSILASSEAHAQAGDLHRVFLNPDEIAVVSIDGKATVLPTEANDKSVAKGNGVYVYRCFQFQMWGPMKKSVREEKLGPYHFFNVRVGEVGYGYTNGKLEIWKQGLHCVDNNKNEWFEGFYDINVDPVNIRDLPITSLHMITSHIDVYVSYSITNPELAILKFKDHKQLHDYIEQITRAEIMRLCAERPPIGYTDMDFDPRAVAASSKTDESKGDIAGIVNASKERVNKLLHQFGIDLSEIDITRWQLDKEFVDRARLNALKLQDTRAANEQAKMESEKLRIQNEQAILALENENNMTRKRMELAAESAIQAAEMEARKATAKLVAEAKARKEAAQAMLDSAKLEREAQEQEAVGMLAKGKAKAEVQAAEVRAKFPDLTGEQRLELEKSRNYLEAMRVLLTDAFKANAQIPGAFTLDPQYLQALMTQQMLIAQQTSNNAAPVLLAPLATNVVRPNFLSMWQQPPQGTATPIASTSVAMDKK